MFEGCKPTPKGIEIIRDYVTGKISLTELVVLANKKLMSKSYKYIDTVAQPSLKNDCSLKKPFYKKRFRPLSF
jgi:hypothetical protein